MNQKILALVLCAMLLAFSFPAEAQQQAKVPRIGLLSAGTAQLPYLEAFRQGLRDLGYVDGKNIVIDWRHAGGKPEQLSILAAELTRSQVNLIVATRTPAIRAAAQATKTIPIVMVGSGDPVAEGVVASLARPGGNVTGLALFGPELNGKRLELLKEAFPKVSRVAVLRAPLSFSPAMEDLEPVARSLRLKLLVIYRTLGREYVEAGGLMSYGVNINDLDRRAATYVNKILKGTKPEDFPVEQPTKFELIINLKAAKQIGLTIPPNVLARADRVIK